MGTETVEINYIQAFRFELSIPGIEDGIPFESAGGFASEFTRVEQPEGSRLTNHKRPGKRQYDDLTLKRGATTSMALWDWHDSLGDAVSGNGVEPVDIRPITLRAKSTSGVVLVRFVFHASWPFRYVPGDFDAGEDGENEIEEVVFCYDRFERLAA
jgi:phage tail-like protein